VAAEVQLGCIECARCLSVCLSVTRLNSAARAVCAGSLGATFAKLLWPCSSFRSSPSVLFVVLSDSLQGIHQHLGHSPEPDRLGLGRDMGSDSGHCIIAYYIRVKAVYRRVSLE